MVERSQGDTSSIVGAVVGVLVLMLIAVVMVVVLVAVCRRRRLKAKMNT